MSLEHIFKKRRAFMGIKYREHCREQLNEINRGLLMLELQNPLTWTNQQAEHYNMLTHERNTVCGYLDELDVTYWQVKG